MKLYQVIQENWAFLGIRRDQPFFNEKSIRTFLLYGFAINSASLFLFFNANTFLEYTQNIYVNCAVLVICAVFTITLFQREKLFKFIDYMERHIDQKSENPASKKLFTETSLLVEECSKIGHFVIANMTPICLVIPKATICYIIHFTTNLGNEAFDLPLLLWYPFDWRNPLGYLYAVAFQYIACVYVFTFLSCAIFFGIGAFLLAVSIIKVVRNDLKLFNENALADENRLLILKRLIDFIENHSAVKKMVNEYSDIYQIIFILLFVWTTIQICVAMLLLQMQIHERDSAVLVLISIYILYAFGVSFTACEFGQRLSDSFEGIDDDLVAFDWYLYPHELQRMLPTILMAAQQSVELRCFGSISVLRESFKKIIKTAFSYFMTMRIFIK